MKKELVIAAYDRDYSWVNKLDNDVSVTVYRKGSGELLDGETLITPNVGRDVHTFFYHLYNRYDTLSDVTFFSQDYPFDHVHNYVDIINGDKDLWNKQARQNVDGCWFFSHYDFVLCNKTGAPHHPGVGLDTLDLEKLWSDIFQTPCPNNFVFPSAGHFAISKEHVHIFPKEFYGKIVNILETQPNAPWELERLEPYIFFNPSTVKSYPKKNAIVIPVYNSLQNHEQYSKCISTWEFYCKKHNIELHLIKGEKYFTDFPDYAAMCYDRWTDVNFPIEEYDRITFVDADTLIRWDVPDINQIFEDNGLDIVVVPDQGGSHTAHYHINQWLGFKPNAFGIVQNYFNAGFVSMKSHHLSKLQQQIVLYKDYYYNFKDIDGHVKGIGIKGGVRIDAMDQTAVNIALQESFYHNITFVSKEFNCQVPYLFNGDEDFKNNYSNFEFLNEGYIFHLGSSTLAYMNLVNEFWSHFKENYNN